MAGWKWAASFRDSGFFSSDHKSPFTGLKPADECPYTLPTMDPFTLTPYPVLTLSLRCFHISVPTHLHLYPGPLCLAADLQTQLQSHSTSLPVSKALPIPPVHVGVSASLFAAFLNSLSRSRVPLLPDLPSYKPGSPLLVFFLPYFRAITKLHEFYLLKLSGDAHSLSYPLLLCQFRSSASLLGTVTVVSLLPLCIWSCLSPM